MPENNKGYVLVVEDDPVFNELHVEYLSAVGFETTAVDSIKAALNKIAEREPSVLLLDLGLPDGSGFEILEYAKENQIATTIIVVTGEGSMRTAVDAMKLGARDYLVKPFDKERLLTTVENAFETQELRQVVKTYREKIDRNNFEGFVGSSLGMQAIYRVIESSANSKANVFITGESGTGKEVCAEAIHNSSTRRKKPFIALNCGAIPKDLIESEVFGHVKGAFTGAISDRKGAVGQAQGGTLFLDEICEMELSLQPKLLRFLQTETFQRVGSEKIENADVRILCATNRDPWQEVIGGRFREDLYYRLHVLPIHLPPLRDRGEDVVLIAKHFLQKYAEEESKTFCEFSAEVEFVIRNFGWPGNVRQLQNVIRNMVVMHEGDTITKDMLPAPLDQSLADIQGSSSVSVDDGLNSSKTIQYDQSDETNIKGQNGLIAQSSNPDTTATTGSNWKSPTVDEIRPMNEIEREVIENAIDLCGGSIPEAAVKLGISAATIYRKKSAWAES